MRPDHHSQRSTSSDSQSQGDILLRNLRGSLKWHCVGDGSSEGGWGAGRLQGCVMRILSLLVPTCATEAHLGLSSHCLPRHSLQINMKVNSYEIMLFR